MLKKVKALVIMNETHSLLSDQKRVLEEAYSEYEILPVPASGWTLDEMKEKVDEIVSLPLPEGKTKLHVIFVSPIPYMIMELTRREVWMPIAEYADRTHITVRIFHNDHREKKELPNGRIIQVVAQEGWVLV